jgi:hypothetical protein
LDEKFTFLQSSFREEGAPGELLDLVFSKVNSEKPLEEPYFGLDRILPLQLLQWSIEECARKKYLPSPPTKWSAVELASKLRFNRYPIRAKAHFLSESGNKVRVLGCSAACVTLALQPFAHWLEGVVSSYPSLKSAFRRSYKGWDFSVQLMRGSWKPSKADGLSVFDLTGASNGLNIRFLRSFGQKIIYRECEDPDQIFYLTQMLELLLAPRELQIRRDHDDDMYRIIHCVNGIHMGDPGTKEMLCITSALLEIMVYSVEPVLPPSQVAGDDNIGIKSKCLHDAIIAKHTQYGNVIHKEKSQWSQIFVWYCEEMLRWLSRSVGMGLAPWQVDYYLACIHVDIVKMRLLSPFSGTSNDQGSEKNPALGKGDALWEFIQNIKRDEIVNFVRHTFFNWMSSYLSDDPLTFLPKVLGGNNVPFIGDREELYGRIMNRTGPIIAALYRSVRFTEESPPLVSVILSRMSSGNVARGIIDPLSFSLATQFAVIAFSQFRDKTRTLDSFLIELQGTKTYAVSHRDASRYARSKGYLNFKDILESLDRLTSMRISMACSVGLFDLDKVLPTRQKFLQSPSQVLRQFVDDELPNSCRLYGASKDNFVASVEDVLSFKKWILEGAPNFITPERSVWVPKKSVTDSLMGMSIDLPYNPSVEGMVPGSIIDTGRKRKINTQPQSRILSSKRTKL